MTLHTADDRALLALQGPEAAKVMARHCPKAESLVFMSATSAEFDGIDCSVSRSGYTGEDGFEISVPARDAETVARALLAEPEVKPIGLGARDSLRLEAGLPLYGHDLDETTSPVEADLAFAIPKSRRAERRFPGREAHSARACATARRASASASARRAARRCATAPRSLRPTARGSASSPPAASAPTVNAPVAMGYVETRFAAPGTEVMTSGRRGNEPAEIVATMPFVPHRYVRSRS